MVNYQQARERMMAEIIRHQNVIPLVLSGAKGSIQKNILNDGVVWREIASAHLSDLRYRGIDLPLDFAVTHSDYLLCNLILRNDVAYYQWERKGSNPALLDMETMLCTKNIEVVRSMCPSLTQKRAVELMNGTYDSPADIRSGKFSVIELKPGNGCVRPYKRTLQLHNDKNIVEPAWLVTHVREKNIGQLRKCALDIQYETLPDDFVIMRSSLMDADLHWYFAGRENFILHSVIVPSCMADISVPVFTGGATGMDTCVMRTINVFKIRNLRRVR